MKLPIIAPLKLKAEAEPIFAIKESENISSDR